MPITSNDLHFYAAERLTQDPDGGGRITATEVVDGVENNVFPDIASGDRIAGRVWLNKVYGAVRTLDDDRYLASRAFISEPPTDPLVSVALFSTGSWSDERTAARSYVEAYVVVGPRSELILYGTHVAGQSLLFAYQSLTAPFPEIGEVYVLSEESGATIVAQQYVRVIKVESSVVTWDEGDGPFQKRLFTLTLSDPLERIFPGGVQKKATNYVPPTLLRITSPVDAASFKSLQPIAAATLGDLEVTADSIFVRVVPATQSETPVVDASPVSATVVVVAGTRTVNVPILAHTAMTAITLANQQLNYTALLIPLPAPQTVVVSYRAQGQWYTLQDTEGLGTLSGSGAGSVNYATGSLAMTFLAIPDVDSAILYAWGTGVHFTTPTLATQELEFPGWQVTLNHDGLEPGRVTLEWVTNGVTKRAVSDDFGNLSGDGVGRVRYATGELWFRPTALPDPGTTPVVRYQYGAPVEETFTPTKDGNGFVTLTTADPITPNSVQVTYVTKRAKTTSEKTTT